MSESGRPSSDEGTRLLFSEATSAAGAVAAIVICVLGSLSNVVTILALALSSLRSHPTTLFVLSLAISDLIYSVYNMPLMAHRFLHRGCEYMCLDYHMCQYFPFFMFGNIGVSIWIMVLIALQRVFGVFRGHLLERVFSRRRVVLMILAVWLLVFGGLYLPLTKTWGQFGYEPQTFSCTVVESEGETFYPVMTACGVGLPCCVITLSYGAIWWKVKSRGAKTRLAAKNRASSLEIVGPNTIMEQTKQRERRITKCFTYIFIAFLVCFTPWALITTFDPMPPSSKGWLHMASYILSWSSVVVNPVIYCVTNRHYQEAYLQLARRLVPGLARRQPTLSRRTEETSGLELLDTNTSTADKQ